MLTHPHAPLFARRSFRKLTPAAAGFSPCWLGVQPSTATRERSGPCGPSIYASREPATICVGRRVIGSSTPTLQCHQVSVAALAGDTRFEESAASVATPGTSCQPSPALPRAAKRETTCRQCLWMPDSANRAAQDASERVADRATAPRAAGRGTGRQSPPRLPADRLCESWYSSAHLATEVRGINASWSLHRARPAARATGRGPPRVRVSLKGGWPGFQPKRNQKRHFPDLWATGLIDCKYDSLSTHHSWDQGLADMSAPREIIDLIEQARTQRRFLSRSRIRRDRGAASNSSIRSSIASAGTSTTRSASPRPTRTVIHEDAIKIGGVTKAPEYQFTPVHSDYGYRLAVAPEASATRWP